MSGFSRSKSHRPKELQSVYFIEQKAAVAGVDLDFMFFAVFDYSD